MFLPKSWDLGLPRAARRILTATLSTNDVLRINYNQFDHLIIILLTILWKIKLISCETLEELLDRVGWWRFSWCHDNRTVDVEPVRAVNFWDVEGTQFAYKLRQTALQMRHLDIDPLLLGLQDSDIVSNGYSKCVQRLEGIVQLLHTHVILVDQSQLSDVEVIFWLLYESVVEEWYYKCNWQ